jgi:hypothetical protein
MLIVKKAVYGTLGELSVEMGLARGTLKAARHRHSDSFPKPVGEIAGHDVYLLSDIEPWYAAHNTIGRPKKV